MTPSIINDPRIDVLHQALSGLAHRQQAIAGNVANVDTPGYQRQDVPFEAQLRSSAGLAGGMQLATTNPLHRSAAPHSTGGLLGGAAGDAQNPNAAQRNDGNNVDIDFEMTQMAETSLRYELLTQATSTTFATLNGIVTRIA